MDAAASDGDAGPGRDAGDAGDAALMGCKAFPNAAFCADFDHDGAVTQGFTGSIVADGTIAIDKSDSVSLPGSFRSTALTKLDGGGTALLTKDIPVPSTTKKVHVELDAKIDALTLTNTVVAPVMRVFRNGSSPVFEIWSGSGTLLFTTQNARTADGGTVPQQSTAISMSLGELAPPVARHRLWRPRLVGPPGRHDEARALAIPLAGPPNDPITQVTLWLGINVLNGSNHPTQNTNIDNVVVTLPP